MLFSPNSKGQEMAKERTQTTEIITVTRRFELYRVLYKSGIATAVYLQQWSSEVGGRKKTKSVSERLDTQTTKRRHAMTAVTE